MFSNNPLHQRQASVYLHTYREIKNASVACVSFYQKRLREQQRRRSSSFSSVPFTTYRAAGPREAPRHANHADAQNGVGHCSNAGEQGRGARYRPRASGDGAGAIAAGHL